MNYRKETKKKEGGHLKAPPFFSFMIKQDKP